MTVVYDPVQPGEDVVAENVQQIIDGITAQTAVAHAMKNDSATVAALTVQSTHATGPALSVKDPAGVEQIKIERQVSSNDATKFYETVNLGANGKLVSRSDGTAPIHSHLWDFYRSDAETGTILLELVYDNNWIGTPGSSDAATAAIIGRRFHGDGYFRTIEIDAINLSDAASHTQPWIGIELSIETVQNGNGTINDTTGISIQNLGEIWEPGAAWKAVDRGLLIGGISTHRLTNFITCAGNGADFTLGLYGSADTVLFNVDYLGEVKSGNLLPRTVRGFEVGSQAVPWLGVWSDVFAGTKGVHSDVQFSLSTGTGVSLPATNAIGFKNNGTETIRITSAGIIDFRNSQSAAPGGGAGATLATIGGSGPTAAAQNTWIKVKINGTDFWVPAWA